MTVEATPLCTWRDAHGERHAVGVPGVETVADGFVFEGRYRVAGAGFQPGGVWYRGARLREESARGLADTEDLWAAGTFCAALGVGQSLDVVAACLPYDELPAAADVIDGARARRRAMVASAEATDGVTAALTGAADQFVVATPSGPGIVAGYPWFGEWSRDTMVSYEGLLLTTDRANEGRALLERFASTVSEGMLANTADTGTLEYNTADGTLWFVHAAGRHVDVTGDLDLAAVLLPTLDAIVEHHIAGTRYGIVVDRRDGLLVQGQEGTALTWMDARIGDHAVTPRRGKAVEIEALWINALGTIEDLRTRTYGGSARWEGLRNDARTAFRSAFVRPDGLGLWDVVTSAGEPVDRSVRPNQLLALSLPFGPGGPTTIVDACRAHLLTSLGLRSLAASDPAYAGRHRGDSVTRDMAYHQGTVWPWLIGPFVDAARRGGADVACVFDPIIDHVREWGLGSISETADGDPPHGATGCPFQAWSVAEVLRITW